MGHPESVVFSPCPHRRQTQWHGDYGDWRAWTNIEFEDVFLKCCGHLLETDELRDDFLTAEAKLNCAFSLVNHLPDCIGYADEVVFFQMLRKQLRKTTTGGGTKDDGKEKAVRDLLDRSIESKGVVDIFQSAGIETPDISILDEAFLGEFKSHEEAKLRLKLLAKILADEIRSREKSNLAKYKSFKEMLDSRSRNITTARSRRPMWFACSCKSSRTSQEKLSARRHSA